MRLFLRRSCFFFYEYRQKCPHHLLSDSMVHIWDIIKNVPSAVSVEVWDKVGIYQIVSLGWSGEMAENGMSQAVALWRVGLGYNKKYLFRKSWDITKSMTGNRANRDRQISKRRSPL